MHFAELIYPLNEAATIANCQPGEILSAGARGEITLLVGVPDGCVLRLVKMSTDGEKIIGMPATMRVPNLLALREKDCFQLQLNGKVLASDFPIGFSLNINTDEVRRLHPSDCDADLARVGAIETNWRDPRRRWSGWCIQGENSPQPLEVVQERTMVLSDEFCRRFSCDKTAIGQERDESDSRQHLIPVGQKSSEDKEPILENRNTNQLVSANYKELANAFKVFPGNEDKNCDWFRRRCSDVKDYPAFKTARLDLGRRGGPPAKFRVLYIAAHLLDKKHINEWQLRASIKKHFEDILSDFNDLICPPPD